MKRLLRIIDTIDEAIGSIASWLIIVMILVIIYEVIARYIFNSPTFWAFDSMRLFGGALIVFGWAYSQLHDAHIRVDIFYSHFTNRKRMIVDVLGSILFFFPLLGAFTYIVARRELSILLSGKIITFSYWSSLSSIYGLILMLGLFLTCLQFAAKLVRDINGLIKRNHDD